MAFEARVQVDKKGGLIIPAEILEALGITIGATADLRVEDHELSISNRENQLHRAQERREASKHE